VHQVASTAVQVLSLVDDTLQPLKIPIDLKSKMTALKCEIDQAPLAPLAPLCPHGVLDQAYNCSFVVRNYEVNQVGIFFPFFAVGDYVVKQLGC
jgi:hypothetical protein